MLPVLHINYCQAPRICAGYQSATYNITICNNQHVIVDQFGPTKYTQQNSSERIFITKELKSGLEIGKQYEVQVTVESLGVLRCCKKLFSKLKMISSIKSAH